MVSHEIPAEKTVDEFTAIDHNKTNFADFTQDSRLSNGGRGFEGFIADIDNYQSDPKD